MPRTTRVLSSVSILLRASASRSTISRSLPLRQCPNLSTQARAGAKPLARAGAVLTPIRRQSQDSSGSRSESASGGGSSKAYGFEEVKDLIARPSKDRILIDTREPSELSRTGRIPTALNIPITSSPDSFFISDDAFEDRFGFQRPGKETEVVFYCKAGVRSRAAAQLARQAGWEKVGEYGGSWLDWEKKGGEVQRG